MSGAGERPHPMGSRNIDRAEAARAGGSPPESTPDSQAMSQAVGTHRDEALWRSLFAELGEEARAYRFEVAPNPCVGALVLGEGRVLARGFHTTWGGPHAEVQALEGARQSGVPAADWDALLVTLEPCSTAGKTPPCTQAILDAGVGRVVVGGIDPNPQHEGRGLELLARAGVEVLSLAAGSEISRVSPWFTRWNARERLRRPRPWTIVKWAQTLTGQLIPPDNELLPPGERSWISSGASRAEVHRLRARVDAVVTGVGTVLADDPRFSVRGAAAEGCTRGPARVILDTELKTRSDARLFASAVEGECAGEVHLLTRVGVNPGRHRELVAAGAQVHGLRQASDGSLSLRAVQSWLWESGFERVLLEAGPTLTQAWLERGFVDQLRVYTGDVRGGLGPSLAEWLDPGRLSDRLDREVGGDAVLEAFPKKRS